MIGQQKKVRTLATLRRSVSLLNSFRYEQDSPELFYRPLAHDTVSLVTALFWEPMDGAVVLDVGGGPGYFADAFAHCGARYIPLEPDPSEMHAAGIATSAAIRGSGLALPIRDDAVDICLSSNVAEHVSDPWALANEMVRVTRPGGMVVLSYTLWYGPFGGHEMGLTHYFGGARAARWYTRRHGHPPKNLFGTSLFRVTAAAGLRWGRGAPGAELVAAFPRYHPWWAWWVMRVPGVREVLGSNVVLVLKKQ